MESGHVWSDLPVTGTNNYGSVGALKFWVMQVQKLEVEKRSTWSSESTQEAKCLLATLFQLQYVVDCTSVGDAEGRRVKKKATTQLLQHLCTRLEILLPRHAFCELHLSMRRLLKQLLMRV